MVLKSIRLARAENLPKETQEELGISEGLVAIETLNPELKQHITPIGNITAYLQTLGDLKEVNIDEPPI